MRFHQVFSRVLQQAAANRARTLDREWALFSWIGLQIKQLLPARVKVNDQFVAPFPHGKNSRRHPVVGEKGISTSVNTLGEDSAAPSFAFLELCPTTAPSEIRWGGNVQHVKQCRG